MLNFLKPEILIHTLGIIGVLGVVFAESGLFFGFFLPGDSLLFSAGLYASQGYLNIWILVIGGAIFAILGDNVGYAFGKRVGPAIFSREDSFFFHKKHIDRAKIFYEKYGVKTIILARFVPVVRTFAPIVAGVGGMKYKTFIMFNAIGGCLWVFSMTLLGFFLGKFVPGASSYVHIIVVFIIILSFLPIFIEWFKSYLKNKRDIL